MPSALTYPGVYIEEIPSGVRTITGVATSITAFIGRAIRGPVNEALTINSYGDFEKTYGGLWLDNALGYAVRDFFLIGGSQAIIVRLYHADPGPQGGSAPATMAPLTIAGLKFLAINPGKWGNNLRVTLDVDNLSADIAGALGLTTADLFNLTVRNTGSGGGSERYLNLTLKDSARRVNKVLAGNSDLLAYDGVPDQTAITALATLNQKAAAYTTAQQALAAKLSANPAADVTAESAALATAKTALDAVRLDGLGQKEAALADAKASLANKLAANPAADVTAEKKAVTDATKALADALTAAGQAISDGLWLTTADFLPPGGQTNKQGLFALEQADLFNLLVIPPYHSPVDTLDVDVNLVSAAAAYCETRRAMLLLDSPKDWTTKDQAKTKFTDPSNDNVGTRSRNAALFFPRLEEANPLRDNQIEVFGAAGAVAGIFARTDTQRGVWKAPAGLDAVLNGVPALSVSLTDAENGELNPLGINCLRAFPVGGRVVWGSRTLRGADQLADEYKYVPVRRTALYIEESLYRGTQWVVFEPNDEPLWAQIRLNIGAFMHNLFRQGAFQGKTPQEAYFVKCDKESTTQNDINLGIVNIIVGFAPLKPAEFVVIKLQQMAGQIET